MTFLFYSLVTKLEFSQSNSNLKSAVNLKKLGFFWVIHIIGNRHYLSTFMLRN